jgi:hypothetical protein
MVLGSVLLMEEGLGLARNGVQRCALETGSEQGFGVGENVAHDVARTDDAAFDSTWGLGKLDLEDRVKILSLACTLWILCGIVICKLGYRQGL